jgi:F0F1-type ATP synthase assembly protein I
MDRGRNGRRSVCPAARARHDLVAVQSETSDVPTQRGGSPPDAGRLMSAGFTAALSIVLFLWFGMTADRWLGSEPLLTIAGVFVGAAAGFYHMFHHLVVAPRRREEKKRDE